jgi:small-conductance mechanosensitive channel
MNIVNLFVEPVIRILPKVPEALLDLLIGYIIIRILMGALNHFLKITKLPQVRGIIISLSKFILWIMLLIFVFNNLGFGNFAIALSGSVLVLAFFLNTGVAPLITDVVAGVFLCTDPDFKTGSMVRLGNGDNATEGIIKDVDMRKVRILDDDGRIHVVPNSVIEKNEWTVIEKKDSVTQKATTRAKEIIKKSIKKD